MKELVARVVRLVLKAGYRWLNAYLEFLPSCLNNWRLFLLDSLMIVVSWFLAYWIRFGLDVIPEPFLGQAVNLIPLVIFIHLAIFFCYSGGGYYVLSWSRGGRADAPTISGVDLFGFVPTLSFVGTGVVAIAVFLMTSHQNIPLGVFPLHGILLTGFMIVTRFIYILGYPRKHWN